MTNPAAPDYQQLAQPAWSDHARRFPPAGTPADPDFHAGGTWPWDWSTMTREQAERMWNRLEGFVAYLNDRYAWDHDHHIPMCWAFHGALVEELTTLYWSRWAAFCGPDANPDKAQAWHTYFLPPFYNRMATWCGGAQNLNKCQSGNHVLARRHEARDGEPARWTAMTARLRENDEDSRPAESVGHAQDGQPAAYPPLTVVPPQPDPPPPDYRGPTSTSLI
jgi:hypothetical protein